jgi:hypothetical protein
MDRAGFLQILDRKLWCPRRLFSHRLAALDAVAKRSWGQDFLDELMAMLKGVREPLVKKALWAHRHLDPPPPTTLGMVDGLEVMGGELPPVTGRKPWEQFLFDLNTYGAREALAYLFEFPRLKLSESQQRRMVSLYVGLAAAFSENEESVRALLEETWQRLQLPDARPRNDFELLSALEIEGVGGVWEDGQPQSSHA